MNSNIILWVYDIESWRILLSIGFILATLVMMKLFEKFVTRWVLHFFSQTPLKYTRLVIQALQKPSILFVLVGGIYLSLLVLLHDPSIPQSLSLVAHNAYFILLAILAIWVAYRFVNIFGVYLEDHAKAEMGGMHHQFVPIILKSLRIFVVLIGILTLLSSLHVDVASILAGLGIGGLAVALAAQDALGNFFGSVALLADGPFQVGDRILVGDKVDGYVENIGFRSTRVRTSTKSLLTIPNKNLANEMIDNWSQLPKRAVKQTLGISYETRHKDLQDLLKALRENIRKDKEVDPAEIIVRLNNFGPTALELFITYYTIPTDWERHLEVKERINLEILRLIEEQGHSMAVGTNIIKIPSQQKSSSRESTNGP